MSESLESSVRALNVNPSFNDQLEAYKQDHRRKCELLSATQPPIQCIEVISKDGCENINDSNPLCFREQIHEYKQYHNDKFKRNVQQFKNANQQGSPSGHFLLPSHSKYRRVKFQKN